MSATETKVDVLAVMDRLIGNARTMCGLTGDQVMRRNILDGEQARAAMAELIEAASLVCDLSSEEWQERDGKRMSAVGNDGKMFVFVGQDVMASFRAALAGMRGAA